MTQREQSPNNIKTQQQKNHTEQDHHNDYYNTRARARGTQATPEQMQAVREAYEDNIGKLTGAVAGMIERALAAGLTPEEVVMACEETGFAPRPSARYLQKVLENWAESGVTVSRLRREAHANQALKWWRD